MGQKEKGSYGGIAAGRCSSSNVRARGSSNTFKPLPSRHPPDPAPPSFKHPRTTSNEDACEHPRTERPPTATLLGCTRRVIMTTRMMLTDERPCRRYSALACAALGDDMATLRLLLRVGARVDAPGPSQACVIAPPGASPPLANSGHPVSACWWAHVYPAIISDASIPASTWL